MAVWPEPIQLALQEPNGARFFRCALQVNPPGYGPRYRGTEQVLGPSEWAARLAEEAARHGVEVIGITSHHDVSEVSLIESACRKWDITVFPGFEVKSREGVHLLCLFDVGTSPALLERYLGEIGATSGQSLASQPFHEIVNIVTSHGGVVIAAHATSQYGLLRELRGEARARAWRHPGLLAIQIPGSIDDLPPDLRTIVRNQDPNYRRDPAPSPDLAIAVINARDVVDPSDFADPAATTLIRMTFPSIEGLRQAFLDPESRVRLNSDPTPSARSRICAISWEGGFLDGVRIHLNEGLNVLVGGRGAGKSTIVESIRYALALDPLTRSGQSTHQSLVKEVLRAGTKVTLLVEASRPGAAPRKYIIERIVPNPPAVRDDSGEVLPLSPRDILPGVEVYGQNELGDLASEPLQLARLLERFVPPGVRETRRRAEIRRALSKNRARLTEVMNERRELEQRLARLPALQEELRRFQEAGLEERLKAKSLLVSEERILQTAFERLLQFKEAVEALQVTFRLNEAFATEEALSALPGADILARIGPILDEVVRTARNAADGLHEAITVAEAKLQAVRDEWDSRRRQPVEQEYHRTLRELRRDAIDGQAFIDLRREVEALEPLSSKAQRVRAEEEELRRERQSLVTELQESFRLEFAGLQKAARHVNERLHGRVRVDIAFCADREPLLQLLRSQVGGRLTELLQALKAHPDLSVPQLASDIRQGAASLQERYRVPPDQARRVVEKGEELALLVEEVELPHVATVYLNVAPEGLEPQWRPMEKLSKGQKATALILILLLEGDAPLVIDQPEDNLDNRFIAEAVVARIRHSKRQRQFLFSTHNGNIPVLGDAELILGLKPEGEADSGRTTIPKEWRGSIDDAGVRRLVMEVLEGGKEAFDIRRRKYGF